MMASHGRHWLLVVLLVTTILLVHANQHRIQSKSQILDCNSNNIHQNNVTSDCSESSSKLKRNTINAVEAASLSNKHRNVAKRRKRASVSEICGLARDKDADDWQPSVVCAPANVSSQQDQEVKTREDETSLNRVRVRVNFEHKSVNVGDSVIIECRLHTGSSAHPQELRLNLQWLRLVESSAGSNQSISSGSDASEVDHTRLRTRQREGGLDLELDSFQTSDVGSYFCRALNYSGSSIIDEARVVLDVTNAIESSQAPEAHNDGSADSLFSQENLSKLLPSLHVYPAHIEASRGESVQLVCTTSDGDPDPDPGALEWTFEPFGGDGRREQIALRNMTQTIRISPNQNTFDNISVAGDGNILIIWSVSEQTAGLYKCATRLEEFNLVAEAVGEVSLAQVSDILRRPELPSVFVRPELVRLPPNGSASIQCEATGYPPPELLWFRTIEDTLARKGSAETVSEQLAATNMQPVLDDATFNLEHVAPRDAQIYCEQSSDKCLLNAHRQQVSSVSILHVHKARAHHQGQYVCQANNSAGVKQANVLIDVELREPPLVRILKETPSTQTIVLAASGQLQADEARPSVLFKCAVDAGKPAPDLRWLRVPGGGGGALNYSNLDAYDLSKVSSVSARVRVWPEEAGRVLSMSLSTTSRDDEGEYVCLGENALGRHSAVARVLVRQPIRVHIRQQSPFTATRNDSFHLDCVASGHPLPTDIEWTRSDQTGAFFALVARNADGRVDRATLKFDRVTPNEAGEYTCQARDPLDAHTIQRDTIMVLVEPPALFTQSESTFAQLDKQLPKIMVRPTRVNARSGSNVTLDCLAVSGLQPTLVEWIAPANNFTGAQSFYQFGSRLQIVNASRAHEGVYQCKGRNRAGSENAPALIKLSDESPPASTPFDSTEGGDAAVTTKTRIARAGSNIELKCQVNGVEQPATSWSRDGLELPSSSVQIGHNLWLQNVSRNDDGLYICSARSLQPNRIIQAQIRLQVRDDLSAGPSGSGSTLMAKNIKAKVVASRTLPQPGESITLECIVSLVDEAGSRLETAPDLNEIERNVVWTNMHTGQSVFQDNVYAQNNLLIIYELRPENSAIYRCNFNELTQHADYELRVLGAPSTLADARRGDLKHGEAQSDEIMVASNGRRAIIKRAEAGASVKLECLVPVESSSQVMWTRGSEQRPIVSDAHEAWQIIGFEGRATSHEDSTRSAVVSSQLVRKSIETRDADLYTCHYSARAAGAMQISYIVLVHEPVARFAQRPVSFVTLPTIAGADNQLDIELRFLSERDHGLILFNGASSTGANNNNQPGDYVLLGLQKGHLEFRFELGDGATVVRSAKPVALNKWHKAVIERSRRNATMWLDDEPPVSNSSSGKFFNLNLDSVLYVGGSEHFMNRNTSPARRSFYGYARGFQGCMSVLRISKHDVALMARNRSVAVGLYECDKPECPPSALRNLTDFCNSPNGVCQPNRAKLNSKLESKSKSSPNADLRCVCLPGYMGDQCNVPYVANSSHIMHSTTVKPADAPSVDESAQHQASTSSQAQPPAYDDHVCPDSRETSCSPKGTSECETLSSSAHKCHCRAGFGGDSCAQSITFGDSPDSMIGFIGDSYVQVALQSSTAASNETSLVDITNVTMQVSTRSQNALLFYVGHQFESTSQRGLQSNMSATNHVFPQTKSMIANLLARLAHISNRNHPQTFAPSANDYLAIAMIDGFVELSYELGSGLAIVRSSVRINDGQLHQLRVSRVGKSSTLIIDDVHSYEGRSPGRLSALNAANSDVYIGGLPILPSATPNGSMLKQLVSSFMGCLGRVTINSLGPVAMSNQTSFTTNVTVRNARNLVDCASDGIGAPSLSIPSTSSLFTSTQKPYRLTPPVSSVDSDDPDELR